MKQLKAITALLTITLSLGGLLTPLIAVAEIRVVDGHLWKSSTDGEKKAYLIGIANTVAVSQALDAKHNMTNPEGAMHRMDSALDADTINTAVDKIDAWYDANPSREGVPVIGVIWMHMVINK